MMNSKSRVPLKEGLFKVPAFPDDSPRLIGSRCLEARGKALDSLQGNRLTELRSGQPLRGTINTAQHSCIPLHHSFCRETYRCLLKKTFPTMDQ